MYGEILGIVLMSVMFVVFGLLRPADRGEEGGGCGGCSHGGGDECGATCPLLKDL